eukprot:scaffold21897_cov59-Phaeocystis_antarctica.AAC.5
MRAVGVEEVPRGAGQLDQGLARLEVGEAHAALRVAAAGDERRGLERRELRLVEPIDARRCLAARHARCLRLRPPLIHPSKVVLKVLHDVGRRLGARLRRGHGLIILIVAVADVVKLRVVDGGHGALVTRATVAARAVARAEKTRRRRRGRSLQQRAFCEGRRAFWSAAPQLCGEKHGTLPMLWLKSPNSF